MPKEESQNTPTSKQGSELDIVKGKLQVRFQELNSGLQNEMNIANRYDLKLRMEELVTVFQLLSK